MPTTRHDFSVAWGHNDSATKASRPYVDDAQAKVARNAFAAAERSKGHKVNMWILRGQRRDYWGWQDPCNITCTVYIANVMEAAP